MWGACAGASSLLICVRPAGSVRARQSGKSMNSVLERELRAGKKDDGGPAAGRVRARQSGKPMNSVLEREPRA